jgi:UDP-glucose 4-epimerase
MQDIDWYEGDFADPSAVATALEGYDIVFHLVNGTTPASANIDKIADVSANVISSIHLLETCRAAGIAKVIFVSSGGTVYGNPANIPTPEDEGCWPITSYGISKLSIEKYLHLFRHLYGMNYQVLRVSNPFGPYQVAAKNQGVIGAFIRQILARQPLEIWGDGSIRRDYVHVSDVVRALELAVVYDGEHHIFNIGSGVARSLDEIVGVLREITGENIEVEYRAGRPVDVPVSVLDTSRAREELNWTASADFTQGIADTFAWMRRQNDFRSSGGNKVPLA